MSSATSGMIGLGNMGGRIARRIRDAGLPVRGFDASPSQLDASEIEPATSIADLAGAVEIIFLSLPESSVVEAVVLGPGGLLEATRPGQIVVDLSTSAPRRRPGSMPRSR